MASLLVSVGLGDEAQALDLRFQVQPKLGLFDYLPGGICVDTVTTLGFLVTALVFQVYIYIYIYTHTYINI